MAIATAQMSQMPGPVPAFGSTVNVNEPLVRPSPSSASTDHSTECTPSSSGSTGTVTTESRADTSMSPVSM